MEVPRAQTILANLVPSRSVMLRHVSGFRGAALTFLPLLLVVASLSAALLVALLIDTSVQLTFWIASWVLFIALSCVCYVWVYRCRQQTQIEISDTLSMLIVTTPFLGAWNFPMKRLIEFQAYTSETAPTRKREFFTMLLFGILALCAIPLFLDWYILLFVIPLILICYPLLQNHKPSPFHSGIVLYFAKTDNLRSLVHAPASIHLCANDTIIQYLANIAEPIVEQNSKSIAD
jgi:hypothetical protein